MNREKERRNSTSLELNQEIAEQTSMEGRRVRRFGMPRPTGQRNPQTHSHNLLPIHSHTTPSPSSHSPATISCCYCDYKFWAFNEPLFHLGRKHAQLLRAWFSVGVGFGLSAMLAVSLILLWELGRALNLFPGNLFFDNLISFCFSTSLGDAAYVVVATLFSVSVHEFGHALAAARSLSFALAFPNCKVTSFFGL